jgi:hypothetical protein
VVSTQSTTRYEPRLFFFFFFFYFYFFKKFIFFTPRDTKFKKKGQSGTMRYPILRAKTDTIVDPLKEGERGETNRKNPVKQSKKTGLSQRGT